MLLCSTSFSFPLNVGLELGQFLQKTISKQPWKRERQVSEQCDPSHRGGALCDVPKTAAMAHVRRFPVLLRQFNSVTYPRRTGGKRLDKNRIRMRTLLFENSGLSFTSSLGPRDPKRMRHSRGGLVAFSQSPFLPFFLPCDQLIFNSPFSDSGSLQERR